MAENSRVRDNDCDLGNGVGTGMTNVIILGCGGSGDTSGVLFLKLLTSLRLYLA